MTTAATITASAARAPRPRSRAAWRRLLRNQRVVAGLVVLGVLAAVAVFAPLLAPYDPEAQVLRDRLQPPGTPGHLLGTDTLGRDLLSRVMWGARISLTIGTVAMLLSVTIGTAAGVAAGFLGGGIDALLMRTVDVFLSLPIFLVLLTVLSIYGSSLTLLIVFLGLSAWPGTARLIRGVVLSLRTQEFVVAARVVGARDVRIMWRHILPNVVPLIVVAATLRIAFVILQEAALSYFGLGVQPPTPTWGNLVADGRIVMDVAWWITTIPGLLVMITVLATNFIGDGLRDVFDPRRSASRDT